MTMQFNFIIERQFRGIEGEVINPNGLGGEKDIFFRIRVPRKTFENLDMFMAICFVNWCRRFKIEPEDAIRLSSVSGKIRYVISKTATMVKTGVHYEPIDAIRLDVELCRPAVPGESYSVKQASFALLCDEVDVNQLDLPSVAFMDVESVRSIIDIGEL